VKDTEGVHDSVGQTMLDLKSQLRHLLSSIEINRNWKTLNLLEVLNAESLVQFFNEKDKNQDNLKFIYLFVFIKFRNYQSLKHMT